jgi:hypothetical protein
LERFAKIVNLHRHHRTIDTYKEKIMATIIIFVVALTLLDLLAWRWGFDSRDSIESIEWERRRAWLAFH